MKVIDDFVPIKYQDELQKLFLSGDFNWFYRPATVNYDAPGIITMANTTEGAQFTHLFCAQNNRMSDYYGAIQPLLFNLVARESLCIDDVYRIKANLMLKECTFHKEHHRTPHVDYSGNDSCTTIIYYINDCDGDTIFFDGTGKVTNRIAPKKGRVVIFDSKMIHAGQPPKEASVRVLLNINIFNTGYIK